MGNRWPFLPSARKALQQMDPNLPLIRPMTQRAQFDTDHFAAGAVCAAGRVLWFSGGGSGGDGTLWNAGVSREHEDGGDRRAHGGGRAARASGVDDSEGQPAAHGSRRW